MKKNLLFLVFIVFSVYAKAQSLIGVQSNYSGSHASWINPASLTTSNLYLDIGLFSFGLNASNDFLYVKSSDLRHFLFNPRDPWTTYSVNGKDYSFMYEHNNNSKNIKEGLDINLFSSMYNWNGKNAIGFSINNRVYTSVNNIPWEIPTIMTETLDDSTLYNHYSSGNTQVSTMEWSEIALSYSRTIYERYQDKIDVGVNLKLLIGYAAVVFDMRNVDYDIINSDTVYVNSFDADIAYSVPINYKTEFGSTDVFKRDEFVKGYGFGFDLGFVYTRKKNTIVPRSTTIPCSYPITDYFWKLGISLLDIGSIKFKNNTEKHSFETSERVFFGIDEFDRPNNFEQLTYLMSGFYNDGDSLASKVDNKFTMGLPSAVSLQFDWNFAQNAFLNLTYVQPIKLYNYSVSRAAQIMLAPRYESAIFDVSIPVTLNNYEYLNLGFAMRLLFLTIGTENIASYLGIGNSRGLDFFVSLKYNFNKGKCYSVRDACWSNEFGNVLRKKWD